MNNMKITELKKIIKQIILEQDDDPNFQKRQDRLTPGKNPDAFYGPGSFFKK